MLISLENEERIETYHIHRGIIVTSGYFKALLTIPGKIKEHEDKTSQTSLNDNKMDIFPFILDYVYNVYDNF